MRNLKKILALVLALVMSLSLMATAGAKDFTDKSAIEATGYQNAVDVLAELEVIRGYSDGSYQPNGDITRAEVAAIIYRIATKDVKDTQASIYSSWGKFADVKDTAWYAGYVNYCANAGIVNGTSATTFEPENKVTGYQVLAMILRAMGYGKNGEFAGGNWAINTAARGKQIGLIDNVLEQQLGANATRALVSEILFRALLTETVDYNAITGYQPNGRTLGQTQFGLEKVIGVVMANEYADLENDSTLAAGKTRLNVNGKDYVLNVSTGLTDIGESRVAYVQKTTQNTFNLLVDKLYDTGLNVRAESGDAQGNIKSFAKKEANLDTTGAEHFVNFGYETAGESEFRLEYQVEFDNDKITDDLTAQEWFESEYDVNPANVLKSSNRLDKITPVGNKITYTRVIPMGNTITEDDIAIMKGIFSVASDENHESVEKVGVSGYVYSGTAAGKDQHDLSSEMSWRAFYAEYITTNKTNTVKGTVNGDWLKIVDNNGDGMADYVFKTVYCMEQVLSENTKQGYFTFGYYNSTDDIVKHVDGKKVHLLDKVEVGDVVLAALIDGKWQVEKAPEEIKVIQTINYREKTATTTEGDVYDQSEIKLHHDMGQDILEMANKVEYTIYFDHFGHVGAYTTGSSEAHYALLTELYQNYDRNGKYLKDTETLVEIKMGEEDLDEKSVTNMTKKLGDGALWFKGDEIGTDYLQRAINHLGTYTDLVRRSVDGYKPGAEFKYPTALADTNVAVYTYDEENDTVEIYPAAQFAENRKGEQLFYSEYNEDGTLKTNADNLSEKVTEDEYAKRYDAAKGADGSFKALGDAKWAVLKPVYAVDYVKLDISKNIGGNQVRYDMDAADASWNQYGMYTGKYQGNYINATHDTEYYVVNSTSRSANIGYYVGYENLPEFAKEDIHAMYAVATNTTAALDKADYWVADVIVIEADGTKVNYDSVALAYFNTRKNTGDTVKYLDALYNMTEDPAVTLVPKKASWPGQWMDYGFYTLFDTDVNEGEVAAASIDKITSNFNAYGINAGTVYRDKTIWNRGDYVMIDRGDGYQQELRVGNVPVYGIVDYTQYYGDWDLYELTTSDLTTGDQIIYVTNKPAGNTLKYIVVANFNVDGKYDEDCDANDWTEQLWADIIATQLPAPETRTEMQLAFNLTGNEEAVVTCLDGAKQEVTATAAKPNVPILVNNPNHFEFTLKAANLAALVPTTGYTFYKTSVGTNEWKITAISNAAVAQSLSAKAVTVVGEAYTNNAVAEIIKQVSKANIGAAGDLTVEQAEALATKLLGIVVNLVSTAAPALDTSIVNTVVDVKVAVILIEDPDLDEDVVREAVKDAVENAVENAEPVSAEEIGGAVQDAVDAAVAEATAVNVTLTAETAGLVKMTVSGDKNIIDVKDDVYTVEKDTVLTVVLVSSEELDADAPVTVTDANGNPAVVTKIDYVAATKTVTITLPAASADVTYKFVLNAAAK